MRGRFLRRLRRPPLRFARQEHRQALSRISCAVRPFLQQQRMFHTRFRTPAGASSMRNDPMP
jgi:hypothetical protein